MRVATDGTQFALRQTLCDPSREPLPLARVHRFNCCRQVPSRASHVSLCPAEDAEWHLVLYAYAGSGSTYDAFRCMLVSRDMDVRLVVAKFVAERSCERSGSLDAIEREAQLYNTALMPLQGNHVPLFYGVFKITPPPERTYDDSAFYVMILEDCGWQATPENEHWSFAFMSEDDK